MKKTHKIGGTNVLLTVLLFLGCLTVLFPLYMTVMIAFKSPTEMTLVPQHMEFQQLLRGNACDKLLALAGQQLSDHRSDHCAGSAAPLYGRLCHWQKHGTEKGL